MPEIIIIAAQTLNRVIGKNNQMPWHLPKDLQYFKKTTLNHTVLMGRNTFQSIGKALPNRRNLVISRDENLFLSDAECFTSPEAAIKQYQHEEKIFIIGGAKIYESLLPIADTLVITWIETTLNGDAFFPEINLNEWREIHCEDSEKDQNNAYDLHFCTYKRK